MRWRARLVLPAIALFAAGNAHAADRGGPIELSVFTSTGGPVGPYGVAAAVLPVSRLALGLALGPVPHHTPPYSFVDRRELRFSIFARGYVIDRPGLRLGLGLATSKGDDAVNAFVESVDGTFVGGSWIWSNVRRVDGSVALELVRGGVALRLEAGMGRMFGDPVCTADFGPDAVVPCRDPGGGRPEPDVLTSTPSRWRPFAQLALVVRPGRVMPAGARATEDEPELLPAPVGEQLRIVAAVAVARHTEFVSDGHYVGGPPFDAGIEADYLGVLWGAWRWGLGARYSYGRGDDKSEHVGFVPALIGRTWRSGTTGDELELLAGLGPAALLFSGVSASYRGLLAATGVGGELGVSFIRPLNVNTALMLGLAVRVLGLRPTSNGDYLSPNSEGIHVELPFHIGLRFRL